MDLDKLGIFCPVGFDIGSGKTYLVKIHETSFNIIISIALSSSTESTKSSHISFEKLADTL